MRVHSVSITVAFGSIGLFASLRTGSGEAVQGLFPVFFLFLSTMALPLNLLQTDWFHTVASVNPDSYLLQTLRSLLIEGWNAGEVALASASPRSSRSSSPSGPAAASSEPKPRADPPRRLSAL